MNSVNDTACAVGCPIRISTDQRLLAAPRGFSQRATSFIASWCQGIHRMPFSFSIHAFSHTSKDHDIRRCQTRKCRPKTIMHGNHPQMQAPGHSRQERTPTAKPATRSATVPLRIFAHNRISFRSTRHPSQVHQCTRNQTTMPIPTRSFTTPLNTRRLTAGALPAWTNAIHTALPVRHAARQRARSATGPPTPGNREPPDPQHRSTHHRSGTRAQRRTRT
jgi:hypothetical protein